MKNSKLFKSILVPAVTLTLAGTLLWGVPSSAAEVNDATVKSYEDQISELTAKQEELKKKIAEAEANLSSAMERKKLVDELIKNTSSKIQTADRMIEDLNKQISAKEAQMAETEAKIASQREAFLGRMASMHEDGKVSYLELILGSTSISSFLTKMDYVNSMMSYDNKVISDLTESKAEIQTLSAALEESKKTQEEALILLKEEQAANQVLANESETIINQLYNDEATWQKQYDDAVYAEKQLDDELQKYIKEQQSANQSNPVFNAGATNDKGNLYIGGEFAWPIPADRGYISSHFGWRKLNGYQDFHAATDIAVAHGTPIYASNGGIVLRSEWHDSYGYYVLIDHGNGISTLYAHMSVLNVSAGQSVAQGDTIGLVGNTGYSFGAHLHFEYRINGQRVDAEQYVDCPYY